MPATKSALASKPLRVLVDGLTIQINASNQLAKIPPAQVVTVGVSGCNFTTIQAAITSITDATASKPYVIQIFPGIYAEQITCKDYVHLLGMGGVAEGAICTRIHASGWVIKTAAAGCYSNLRFELDTGTTSGTIKIVDGQGTTISGGRSVFHNCYFVVNGNYGSANVKISENNAAQSVVTFSSCLAYYNPTTTSTVVLIHSLTGATDCLDFRVTSLSMTVDSSILWKKDDSSAFPDNVDGLTISREYSLANLTGSATSTFIFVNNSSATFMQVSGVHGLNNIGLGAIIGGTFADSIFGQNPYPSDPNRNMAASATTGDFQVACSGQIVQTPAFGSPLIVTVNGIRVVVGNGDRTSPPCDCYFYDGTTVKKLANVIQGDQLYWVGSVAGYQLETTDRITFDYGV